jgi:hypothetical protein
MACAPGIFMQNHPGKGLFKTDLWGDFVGHYHVNSQLFSLLLSTVLPGGKTERLVGPLRVCSSLRLILFVCMRCFVVQVCQLTGVVGAGEQFSGEITARWLGIEKSSSGPLHDHHEPGIHMHLLQIESKRIYYRRLQPPANVTLCGFISPQFCQQWL